MYFAKFFSCAALILLMLSQDITAQEITCGDKINSVLDGICVYGYNTMVLPKRKRSEMTHYGLDGVTSDIDIAPSPFLYGGIVNLMTKTRRRRHGVYYECCRKGCTYNEFMLFCKEKDDSD